jgi:hypothetical protein
MGRAVAFAISRMRKLIVAECPTAGALRYVPVVTNPSLGGRATLCTRAQHLHVAQHAVTGERGTGVKTRKSNEGFTR